MTDRACPQCRANGGDREGNHLYLMSDGITWYCNRCKYIEKEGKESKPMATKLPTRTAAFNKGDFGEVSEAYRGIKPSTFKTFKALAEYSEADMSLKAIVYSYGDWAKVRVLPKRFVALGESSPTLYGKGVIKSDTLVITEGENDCLAAFQMLKDANPNVFPAVVSLPNGAGGAKAVSAELDWIKKHKKVILCLDNDDAGKKGKNKILKLLEGDAYVTNLTLKDPHEYLEQGKAQEFVKAIKQAARYKPSGIVEVGSVIKHALKKPEWGLSFPWDSLTKASYGIRMGEGWFVGAGVKVGKSEWLNTLATHIIKQGEKPFIVKAEELPSLTIKKLAGLMNKKFYHRPDIEVDMDELEGTLHSLEDKLLLYSSENHIDWEDVKEAIRHAVVVEGCKYVFIDPITCMTDGLEPSEANTMLQKFSREIDTMAKTLGFAYFVFCHLNAPKTGKGHENGGKVCSNQFTGSRVMMRSCTYMLGIQRDKDPELSEEERNTSQFVLLEDRMFGNNVVFDVFYNRDTGEYLEPEGGF